MRPIVTIILLLALCGGFTPLRTLAQDSARSDWSPPYKLDTPAGWGTEHFPLPPQFASQIPFKGMEDIRFSHGWGDSTSEEHWAYAFLWWLDGKQVLTAERLQTSLKDYYTGLVGINLDARKIPKDRVVPVKTFIQIVLTAPGDRATFSGTVYLLDYMTQKPITLNVLIHWKYIRTPDHTAVFFEVSPRPTDHHIWQQLNELNKGLRLP